jgi:four helix bundle protein
MPRDRASDVVAHQLLRAVTSIAANIAEGYGRYSRASYRNHLSIARGSAFEVESWLDLVQRRGWVAPETAHSLLSGCVEVQKLLTLRMKSLEEATAHAVREEESAYEL